MSTFGNQEKSKQSAKAGIDLERGARRRAQQGVKMRANARDEMMMRKRRGEDHDEGDGASTRVPEDQKLNPFAYGAKSRPADVPLQLLGDFVQLCYSNDAEHQFQGTMMIRKLLSVENEPPIDAVIATNIPRKFVDFLASGNTALQFEAAWALTNVASGEKEHSNYVLQINAAPGLKDLLFSEDADCREQATWALGNLAGDNARCRDYIIGLGVIQPLLNVLSNNNEAPGVHKNAAWSLANLCRGRPVPPLDVVAPCLPAFVYLLGSDEEEIVMDAAWGISYVVEGGQDRVAALLKEDPLSRIIGLLGSSNTSLVTPALRTIGSIVTGSDTQTQLVIDAGLLNSYHFLLSHVKRGIRKEACWTISNILAGTPDQVQQVISNNLMPQLLRCMFASEHEVKKEAVWAIANFTSGASGQQISHLVSLKGFDNLCEILMNSSEARILAVVLEACDNILGHGQQYMIENAAQCQDINPVTKDMVSNGGLRAVERLQVHSNSQVSDRAGAILDRYFDVEDDDDDNGMGGDGSTGNQNQQDGHQDPNGHWMAGGNGGSGGGSYNL